jgi:hypothetical protein
MVDSATPRAGRINPLAALIVAVLVGGCAGHSQTPSEGGAAERAQIGALTREARPIGAGPRFRPALHGQMTGACRRGLGPRYGVHVEVFAADRVVLLPAGIGTRPPRRRTEARISAARCFGDVVTLEPTGVALVRPGERLTLSALFRAWGQLLTATRLASFSARPAHVAVFVNGRRWRGAPARVPLTRHAEIVLEVGPFVPPHVSYTFPPGV